MIPYAGVRAVLYVGVIGRSHTRKLQDKDLTDPQKIAAEMGGAIATSPQKSHCVAIVHPLLK